MQKKFILKVNFSFPTKLRKFLEFREFWVGFCPSFGRFKVHQSASKAGVISLSASKVEVISLSASKAGVFSL